MSQLDTIMSDVGIPTLLEVFGDDVTITPRTRGSTPFVITAMVDSVTRYVGEAVDVPEVALRLQCAKSDWPEPQRGDTVLYKSGLYKVDRLEPDAIDAHFTTAWLIHA